VTVAPLTKLLPFIRSVWLLFELGTGLGETPLTVGTDDVAVTVKLKVPEVCESGLVTETVQVPLSLASSN
jgi:hypothetical protein